MNDKPEDAWRFYSTSNQDAPDRNLLEQIANDCYKRGHFLIAVKAFNDLLINFDGKSNTEFERGLEEASIGVLKGWVLNKSRDDGHFIKKQLDEMLEVLEKRSNIPRIKAAQVKILSVLNTI